MDCAPAEEHAAKCLPAAAQIERTEELAMYLCPGAASASTGS